MPLSRSTNERPSWAIGDADAIAAARVHARPFALVGARAVAAVFDAALRSHFLNRRQRYVLLTCYHLNNQSAFARLSPETTRSHLANLETRWMPRRVNAAAQKENNDQREISSITRKIPSL